VTRAFHRGAAVSLRRPDVSLFSPRMFALYGYVSPRDRPANELTGLQLSLLAKPSRQRRKGPIIRFGGRKP
jgi:hypothetical protein